MTESKPYYIDRRKLAVLQLLAINSNLTRYDLDKEFNINTDKILLYLSKHKLVSRAKVALRPGQPGRNKNGYKVLYNLTDAGKKYTQ